MQTKSFVVIVVFGLYHIDLENELLYHIDLENELLYHIDLENELLCHIDLANVLACIFDLKKTAPLCKSQAQLLCNMREFYVVFLSENVLTTKNGGMYRIKNKLNFKG
jgi:hypothetical protein